MLGRYDADLVVPEAEILERLDGQSEEFLTMDDEQGLEATLVHLERQAQRNGGFARPCLQLQTDGLVTSRHLLSDLSVKSGLVRPIFHGRSGQSVSLPVRRSLLTGGA